MLAKQTKYAEAISKYQQAVQHNDLDRRSYDCWGAALVALTNYELALVQYKTALSINPSDTAAYRGWGDLPSNKAEAQFLQFGMHSCAPWAGGSLEATNFEKKD
jgi:tetratricopeptide (TPR) repeat protein